jgi:hypothetical protein
MCRVPCALPSAVCSALEIMPRTLPNGTWPWRPNTTKNILAEMVDHNRSANSQKVITRIVIQVPKHFTIIRITTQPPAVSQAYPGNMPVQCQVILQALVVKACNRRVQLGSLDLLYSMHLICPGNI